MAEGVYQPQSANFGSRARRRQLVPFSRDQVVEHDLPGFIAGVGVHGINPDMPISKLEQSSHFSPRQVSLMPFALDQHGAFPLRRCQHGGKGHDVRRRLAARDPSRAPARSHEPPPDFVLESDAHRQRAGLSPFPLCLGTSAVPLFIAASSSESPYDVQAVAGALGPLDSRVAHGQARALSTPLSSCHVDRAEAIERPVSARSSREGGRGHSSAQIHAGPGPWTLALANSGKPGLGHGSGNARSGATSGNRLAGSGLGICRLRPPPGKNPGGPGSKADAIFDDGRWSLMTRTPLGRPANSTGGTWPRPRPRRCANTARSRKWSRARATAGPPPLNKPSVHGGAAFLGRQKGRSAPRMGQGVV